MITLAVVAVSVGLGNFGAATAIGIGGVQRRTKLVVAILFGLFEGGVPILGVLIGRSAAGSLGSHASLVGGLLLCAAGVYVLIAQRLEGHLTPSSTSLPHLVFLSAILSIDNLVVGFGLGAYRVSLVTAAVVLGAVGVILGLAGLELGSRIGARAGAWSESLAGVVLICVGAAIAAGA